jgi:hypothetical protein
LVQFGIAVAQASKVMTARAQAEQALSDGAQDVDVATVAEEVIVHGVTVSAP